MNKSQLISAIANLAEIPISKAEQALKVALDSIDSALTAGKQVSLTGFGSFGVKERSARKVRNPRTGNAMMIDATTVPYFKPGKHLKAHVDQSSEIKDEKEKEKEN